jgi:DNA-binding MarR family transcriptional regulator
VSSRNDSWPELNWRLGYLLKHAQLQMAELAERALAPLDLNGREFAVLLVIAGHEPGSQQQAAARLGVDRTTMVTLLDTLEAKSLVLRHPQAEDRRRNVVELTGQGRATLKRAVGASDRAEAQLLASLAAQDRDTFRKTLHAIVTSAR